MVAIALVAYAVLAWFRPRIALGVLLFLIPFGHLVRFTIAGVPFTFPEVAVYVLAAALLLRRFFALPLKLPLRGGGEKKKSTWLHDPWTTLPLLWLLVSIISAAYSPNALRAWGIWKAYFLAPVVLFWVTRALYQQPSIRSSFRASSEKSHNAVRASNDVRSLGCGLGMTSGIVLPLTIGAFVVAAIAILQRWWPIGVPYPWSVPGKFRATSVFGYPNAVGLYLAPLVPVLLSVAFSYFSSSRAPTGSRGEKSHTVAGANNGVRFLGHGLGMTIVFWSAALLSFLAIIFAKSTGALIALAGALPVLLFLVWRASSNRTGPTYSGDRRNRWGARRVSWGAVGIILVWVAASLVLTAWLPNQPERPRWGPPLVQKLTFQQWSGSVRLAQYRETWQLLRDHSIRGAGLAGYQQAIAPYHEDPRVEIFLYPHNLLLAVWVELGLAGTLIFLAISYHLIRRAFIIHDSLFIIPSLLVILIHGLVDVPYFKNDLAMVFWVIVVTGVIAVVDRRPVHRVR